MEKIRSTKRKVYRQFIRTNLSYRVNIHHLFLSSKRIAFFTERLPYYIFSYKHYTFHVRHYRFRIPGKFFFFFDLSDKICMYIYFTRTNRICIIHRRKKRNTTECIEILLCALRDIHFFKQ